MDIDGTMLRSHGTGRKSFRAAAKELFGRDDVFEFGFSGLTDRLIARLGLEGCGQEVTEERILAFLTHYEGLMDARRHENWQADILPGVVEFLDAVDAPEHIAVGVGTGNTRVGASVKLGWVDLWERFSFGGFGDDHEDRGELIRMGAERGAAQLGVRLSECRIVVVGDSIPDVEAAHAVAGECLAVCTGWTSVEDLKAAGADRIVENLEDPAARAFILSGP
jgi:phosphoglycolate phosphatase-like HAD superfamily hydrolase